VHEVEAAEGHVTEVQRGRAEAAHPWRRIQPSTYSGTPVSHGVHIAKSALPATGSRARAAAGRSATRRAGPAGEEPARDGIVDGAANGTRSRSTPTDTAKPGIPRAKLLVPSMGSRIHA